MYPGSLPACRGAGGGYIGGIAAELPEAERFAAAVPDMPANVRRFFQAEEPIVSRRQSESAQDRLEREARASFGGWCG